MLHVHIGQGKTGTTSLQAFLRLNRALLAREGIAYPEGLGGGGGNATPAALAFAGELPAYFLETHPALRDTGADFEALWRDLVVRAPGDPADRLVSSEELFELDPARFAQRTRFDGHDKRIVAFLRRQDELIESAYLQIVRAGLCVDPFDRYLEIALDAGTDTGAALRYHDVLERWAAAFGRDRLTVLRYAGGQPDRVLFEDFLAAIGLRLTDAYAFPPRANPASHPLIAEYLRNATLQGRNDGRLRARIAGVAARLGLATGRQPLLSPAQRTHVLGHFEAQNRRVADTWFPGSHGRLFAAPDPDALPAHFELRDHADEYARLVAAMDATDPA